MAELEHRDKQVRRRRWQGFALAWALPAQAAAGIQWNAPASISWLLWLWALAPFACGVAALFLTIGRERPLRDGAEGFLMGAFSILAAGVIVGVLVSLAHSL